MEAARARQLVVVESPTKAKTLQRYLGPDFVVRATSGHVKDLPEGRLGIDPRSLEPEYRVLRGKGRVLQELGKEARLCERVLLATDPDREGEAIAWHVVEELGCEAKAARVRIHELTPAGLERALREAAPLDRARYDAQQTRRLLDRLVGFRVSPVLSRAVKQGLSAGRVQSVALHLVVERERAIRAFRAEARATIELELSSGCRARLAGGPLPPAEAEALLARLRGAAARVREARREERVRPPPPPFVTVRLQQEAFATLRFGVKKTMRLAQSLYEGVELGPAGPVSLVTYARTDSPRVAEGAAEAAREHLRARFGDAALPPEPPLHRAAAAAQEAHEAIRPATLELPPELVKAHLPRDHARLYELIWRRFLASQLGPARYAERRATIDWGGEAFQAVSLELVDPGFLRAYEGRAPARLEGEAEDFSPAGPPPPEAGEPAEVRAAAVVDAAREPPARHTEASLLGELEALGVGRPSTYASIVDGLIDRGYVAREAGWLVPTELGAHVAALLGETFPELVDPSFSARLEAGLDRVAAGELDRTELLRGVWEPLDSRLERARAALPKAGAAEVDEACPRCAGPMRLRWGASGPFLSCAAYPACRGTKDLREVAAAGGSVLGAPARPGAAPAAAAGPAVEAERRGACPRCGAAMVERRGRSGPFLACTAYPACRTTLPVTLGIACPACGDGRLAERRSRWGRAFFGCDRYPACSFSLRERPVPQPCPACGAPFLVQRFSRRHGAVLACASEGCGHARAAAE